MKQSEALLSPRSSSNRSIQPIKSVDVHTIRSRNRVAPIDRLTTSPCEEALVVDERSALRPAQIVETKLTRMIKNASLPVSHLQMRALLHNR